MNNSELIFKLVEMLLESEKKQEKNINYQNNKKEDWYITNQKKR